MSKFSQILPVILFLCFLSIHAQSIEQEAEYAEKICKKVKSLQPRYQKLIVEQFNKKGDSTNVDNIEFVNVYTIYANKKAIKIMRKNLNKYIPDSFEDLRPVPLKKDKLLTYIDPQRIDCNHCFLYRDSVYFGMMTSSVNKRKKWDYRPIPFYCMEKEDKNKKNALYEIITKVKPDVVFEICQGFEYFIVKERNIYGLIYDIDLHRYYMVTLKEYIDHEISEKEIPLDGKKSMRDLSRQYPFGVKYATW